MKKILLSLLLASSFAYAQPKSNALCELYKAKADFSAKLLSSPYIYADSNQNNTATIALGYSFSGLSKANIEKEMALAKCSSTELLTKLEEYQQWTIISVQKAGAKSEIPGLQKAILEAKKHVESIEKQLLANTATISEYNNTKQVLTLLENKFLILKVLLAEPTMPIDISDVKSTLLRAKTAEGELAELIAKREAASAWDITLGIGAQKDLVDSKSTPEGFVGIGFKWSFGNYGVKDSIENIKRKSEQAFSSGPETNANRLLEKIEQLILVETDRQALLDNNIKDIERLLNSLINIETAAAIQTRQALTVQLYTYTSERDGTITRLHRYKKFILNP